MKSTNSKTDYIVAAIIQRCKQEDIIEFKTLKSATVVFNQWNFSISDITVKSRLEIFKKNGITINVGLSVEGKARESIKTVKTIIERCKEENINYFENSSRAIKKINEWGLNADHRSIKRHREIYQKNGITIYTELDAKGKAKQIDNIINKCKKKKETEFPTIYGALRTFTHWGFAISYSSIRKRIDFFAENGVIINTNPGGETLKQKTYETIVALSKKCKNESVIEFESPKSASIIFSEWGLKIGVASIRRYADIFANKGIVIKAGLSVEKTREKTKKNLDAIITKCKKEEIFEFSNIRIAEKTFKEWGFEFGTTAINNHLDVFQKNNITMHIGENADQKVQRSNKTIDAIVKRCKSEGISEFKTAIDAERIFKQWGLSLTDSTIKSRLNLFKKNGITITTPMKDFTSNQSLAIEEAESMGIKLENPSSLAELSEDFLGRKIHTKSMDRDRTDALRATSSIFYDFTTETVRDTIQQAMLNLILDDKEDCWILELKQELLLCGYYFTEKTIISTLETLGIDTSKLLKDDIERRLRLAQRAANENMLSIKYTKILPDINNTEDASIIIKDSIGNSRSFMSLWREFSLFMITNNIANQISKTPIPSDWDGTLDSLIATNPSYARAFFLDSEHIEQLESLSYEGLAALTLYAARGAKDSLPRMFWGLRGRVSGFFAWLASKGLALSHPKYFQFTGGDATSKIATIITQDHPVINLSKEAISNEAISSTTRKKLRHAGTEVHLRQLAISLNPKADLKKISNIDIIAYIHSTEAYAVASGVCTHKSYTIDVFKFGGNPNAILHKKTLTIDEWYRQTLATSNVSLEASNYYAALSQQILNIVKFRISEDGISPNHAKTHLRAAILLFEFLSEFKHKLSRIEMETALNPIIQNDKIQRMADWAKIHDRENDYRKSSNYYGLLFERLELKEYKNIYNSAWKLKTSKSSRSLIRGGLELPILVTFRDIAIHRPPHSPGYPFLRSSPTGIPLDLSWWKHKTSPIPAFFSWLIAKLPRRMMHIRWLDVNTFMQYDSENNFTGLYVNTDKNRKSDNLFIRASLVQLMFTDDDLKLLEHYVSYIKQAYTNMIPVKYESSDEYAPVMPLFPHHELNSVISEQWAVGYHNKIMLKAQYEIREKAAQGIYDEFYNEEVREQKIKYLTSINLVVARESKKHKKLPCSIEEIDNYTDAQSCADWSTISGIHNMRHAGASTLLHMGLSPWQIQDITGHASLMVLYAIYLHSEQEQYRLIKQRYGPIISQLDNPEKAGAQAIDKIFMPIVESGDPKNLLRSLQENGFMTLTRTLKYTSEEKIYGKKGADILVDNGLEIAAKFHPISMWNVLNHGICTIDKQCPDGTNRICSLCPHLMFSVMHFWGIAHQIQEASFKLKLLGIKLFESRTGNNSARQDLRKKHDAKMLELIGWQEALDKISEQLIIINSTSNSLAKLPTNIKNYKNPIGLFRLESVDQAATELLSLSKKLKINDPENDDVAARLSYKMVLSAAKNYDKETIAKMEKEGISWFIDEYGEKAIGDRAAFLLKYIEGINQPNNSLIEHPNDSPAIKIQGNAIP